jgi:hypothetical protein
VTENAVLYALSTLAQTCAALAALVGAVGLYRLGLLGEQQRTAEVALRVFGSRTGLQERDVVPIQEVIGYVGRSRARANEPENLQNAGYQAAVRASEDALVRWNAFGPRSHRSRWALIAFEAWNLLLIGASVAGFNYIPCLMSWPGTFWSLWAAAVGTVVVTGYCVYAWTRA